VTRVERPESRSAAARVGLKYVTDGLRGITRRRVGTGWAYYTPGGERITARDARERINRLAIPPAWTDVWICPRDNGHIQAVGTDAAGRRQYLYHDQWRLKRDAEKFDRVLRLARRLPCMRQAIAEDLSRPGLGRERVLAAALRMLDLAVFRVGSERYEDSFGLATLRVEHVRVRRGRVFIDYLAKGGIQHSVVLEDPALHRVIVALCRGRAPSEDLLVYRCPDGLRDVRSDDVNARIKELAGEEFTAKDIRTWSATVLAATSLAATVAAAGPPTSLRKRQRAVTAAMREVAEHLGNTPAVARRSYVDPRVIERFEQGVTVCDALMRAGGDLSDAAVRDTMERAVLEMLSQA
jgi:DNA topoisomerase I